MASVEERLREYNQSDPFKRAMKELAKNRKLTLDAAEKAIGLEADFTEQVDRGIKKLTLEDVIKISKYFNTTMESVLNGGNAEINVENRYHEDKLSSQYFAECVRTYIRLLDDKCRSLHFKGLMDDDIAQTKAELSRKEVRLAQRYNTYMEDIERQVIQPMDASNCCDEVLINELVKRGFKVEKGNGNGKKTNKSGR
ncbi:hypothetical protein D7V94_13705 [Parablautia intestinalis]|uniref:Uncharacterized protein n=1 Tax=Parablautia intestinalis TaxID=2320100 RepID=A0A3A9AGS2_9FIRM|nr:hypothetical protein [Parablautia intestinalis]RKI90478.1 hypothetical protein D7V94_13705 [Parablautia intestinalis]